MRRSAAGLLLALLAGVSAPAMHAGPARAAEAPRPTAPYADPAGDAAWKLYEAGRYAEAEPELVAAVGRAERRFGPDHPNTVPSLTRLGLLRHAQARYAEAEALLRRTLAIRERALSPDNPALATSMTNVAKVLHDQGRYGEAAELLKRALESRERVLGRDHADVATALIALARLYRVEGRYVDAEPLYRRALAIRERADGARSERFATALGELAVNLHSQGRYPEAEQLYRRALATAEGVLGPDNRYVANIARDLGNLYTDQERFAEAGPLLERALAIQERVLGPDHPVTAGAAINLAALHASQRRFEEALPLLLRALAANEARLGPNHRYTASVLNRLGRVYTEQRRFAEAEPALRRALAINEAALGRAHPVVAATLGSLAKLLHDAGRVGEAVDAIRQAAAIQDGRMAAVAAAYEGGPADEPLTRRYLYPRYVRIGWRVVEEGAPERAALLDETFRAGQLVQSGGAAAAVARVAARFAAGEDELARVVRERQDAAERWRALDRAVLDALGRAPEGDGGAAADVARLRAELAAAADRLVALDAELGQRFPEYDELTSPTPPRLHEVQRLLAPDELLLAYAVLPGIPGSTGEEEAVFAWAVRADRASMLRLRFAPGELEEAVRRVRSQLDPGQWPTANPPRFDLRLAHALHRELLPGDPDLLAGVRHLLIVPHGPLESLPFSVLVGRKPGPDADYGTADWLARSYTTTTLPAVSSLRALRRFAQASRGTVPFRGVGDPALGGEPGPTRGIALAKVFTPRGLADPATIRALPPLPEAGEELRTLARMLGADGSTALMLRDKATESAVKSGWLAGTRYVAFATHAGVAGEIGGMVEPSLVLTPPAAATAEDDGLLTASEAAQLALDADLVLLSACNTAAPDGTPGAPGLSGLAKAFIYAGSRALLVSHWQVDSEAARRLTTRMFSELAIDPAAGPSEALRRSMVGLVGDRSRDYFAHPAAWAPFVIVGEGARRTGPTAGDAAER